MRSSPPRTALFQALVALGALASAVIVPPSRGAMMLVPVLADQSVAVRVAVAHGARLIGTGRGGTLLVWADADALAPLAAAGVITLAVPFTACSEEPA